MAYLQQKRQNKRKRSLIAFALLGAAIFGAEMSCATMNPVTKALELQFLSEAQEIELGEEAYYELIEEAGGEYTDNSELSAYVERIGQKLAANSDRPHLPYEFVVIDNDTPNAWALPGGKIAINLGLIDLLDSEAELAAVLGHEIAHASARHSAQRIEKYMIETSFKAAEVITNPLAAIVSSTEIGEAIHTSKYSRDAEIEADVYGMEYMARAGYDVTAAVEAHEHLHDYLSLDDVEESMIQKLYNSHPDGLERIALAKRRAKLYPSGGMLGKIEYQTVVS